MKNKIFIISILIISILQILFINKIYAVYNIDKNTINNLVDNYGYILSNSYKTEQLCNINLKGYNNTVRFYTRSNCFYSDNNYYYFKCDTGIDCEIYNIMSLNTNIDINNQINISDSTVNTSGNIENNDTNIINTTNDTESFIPAYIFRTYNKNTSLFYLKASKLKSYESIITHNGESIEGTVIISNNYVRGTKPVYISTAGADGYLSYIPTNKQIGYIWEKPGNGRIVIYNCIRGNYDYFISYDKSCEGNKRFDNNIFYVYPDLNNNAGVTGDAYITLKNDLNIIAYTSLPKQNISFCTVGGNCVKLSNKWRNYTIFGINYNAGYKITIQGAPTKVYEMYFKYVDEYGNVIRSKVFNTIIDNSVGGNVKIIGNHNVLVNFSIPENTLGKFYFNYNGGNYNLIDEGWNIIRNNGLKIYTQDFSGLFSGLYKSYVVYGTKKLNLNTIIIK